MKVYRVMSVYVDGPHWKEPTYGVYGNREAAQKMCDTLNDLYARSKDCPVRAEVKEEELIGEPEEISLKEKEKESIKLYKLMDKNEFNSCYEVYPFSVYTSQEAAQKDCDDWNREEQKKDWHPYTRVVKEIFPVNQ